MNFSLLESFTPEKDGSIGLKETAKIQAMFIVPQKEMLIGDRALIPDRTPIISFLYLDIS